MTIKTAGMILFLMTAAVCLTPSPAGAQSVDESAPQLNAVNIAGTVVSAGQNTMVVRLDSGLYQLFTFDRNTERPEVIPVGSRVATMSTVVDESGVRVAQAVSITGPAAELPASDLPPAIPPSLRQLEQNIERQARRYGVGVRAGVGLDPELVLVGVHGQVGPVFHPDVYFRPNVELGLGEVTALLALNLEAVYRLPGSSQSGRWSVYAGAGPGFNFTHENFERFIDDGTSDGDRIDFGDFDNSTSLNILGGVQYRSGLFIELKSSLYSTTSSGLRLILGYNF